MRAAGGLKSLSSTCLMFPHARRCRARWRSRSAAGDNGACDRRRDRVDASERRGGDARPDLAARCSPPAWTARSRCTMRWTSTPISIVSAPRPLARRYSNACRDCPDARHLATASATSDARHVEDRLVNAGERLAGAVLADARGPHRKSRVRRLLREPAVPCQGRRDRPVEITPHDLRERSDHCVCDHRRFL